MHEDKQPFTPEQVDEQIIQLSPPSSFIPQGSASEQRLVRELQASYGADQETARAVEQVWQRLQKSHSHLMHHASLSSAAQTSTTRLARSERASFMEQHQKRKRWQIMSALAAALLLIIVAGGLVSLATKSHTPTAGTSLVATQQPISRPTPTAMPGAYLYITASTMVYKLDPSTGRIKWRYQVGTDPNTANITYTSILLNNAVYFADQSSALYALDAQTGTLKWKLPAARNDTLSHPLTDGTTLYIHSANKGLCSVNTRTGKILQCYANLNPSIAYQGVFYGFDPASDDFHKTSIYAFDTAQNKKLWEKPISLAGQAFQEMTFANGKLYATSETAYDKANIPALSSYLYAYNAQSGALIWQSMKVASDLILRPPAVGNGAVYFGSQDGHEGALSATDGHLLWNMTTCTTSDGRPCPVYPTPAVSDGVVYMGVSSYGPSPTDNYITALNASQGTKIWKHLLTTYMGSQLLLHNRVIYVGSGDGQIYALQASDGSEIWHTKLDNNNIFSQGFTSGQDDLLLA